MSIIANSPLGDAPDSSCTTVVRGRTYEPDEPRPPLGHARTEQAISDHDVRHNRWLHDKAAKEAADRVMADLLARRVVLPEDLERAAARLRERPTVVAGVGGGGAGTSGATT